MPSLGQTLLNRRDINLIQLNLALDFRVFYGGKLGTNLLELGILGEQTLSEALSEHMGVPPVRPGDLEDIQTEILQTIPREVAYRAQAVPFRRTGTFLYVAVADPRNERALKELREATGEKLMLHVAPELRIQMALERHYQVRMDPRMRNLAAKVVARHETRPPAPSAGLGGARHIPIASTRPAVSTNLDWITDEQVEEEAKAQSSPPKVTLSIQKIALLLDEATSRDEIAELALEFSCRFLKRAALFVLRKDIGFGWNGKGEGLTRDQVKAITIPLSEPSIFQTVVESQGHFLGTVPETPVNQRFLQALGGEKPLNVLLLPLTIGGITFGAIYGDNGTAGVDPEGINELQVMVCRVNIAFEKLILAERQKALRHVTA